MVRPYVFRDSDSKQNILLFTVNSFQTSRRYLHRHDINMPLNNADVPVDTI